MEKNTVLENLLLPKSKHYELEYETQDKTKLKLEFDYTPPSIKNYIAISKQATDLLLSFNIPATELDNPNTPYKNEINIINIISHLAYTITNLKVNGVEQKADFFLNIKDLNLLFFLFQRVTEDND